MEVVAEGGERRANPLLAPRDERRGMQPERSRLQLHSPTANRMGAGSDGACQIAGTLGLPRAATSLRSLRSLSSFLRMRVRFSSER